MPLMIANTVYFEQIWNALLTISGCDAGLVAHQTSTGASLVIFSPATTSPSTFAQRLRTICDDTKSITTIYGVDATYVDNFGPITAVAGITDSNITKRINSIYIDVTGAGGYGYRVLDANGNYVAEPTESILYHELAHAFHNTIALDYPKDLVNPAQPDPVAAQTQAIADENPFRASVDLPLRAPVDIGPYDLVGAPTVGKSTVKGCNDGPTWSLDKLIKALCG